MCCLLDVAGPLGSRTKAAAIAVAVWVILDMEYPHLGLIRVNPFDRATPIEVVRLNTQEAYHGLTANVISAAMPSEWSI